MAAEVAKKAAEVAKKATEKAEAAKKYETAVKKLETHSKTLERELRNGLNTGQTRIDLKYDAKEVKKRANELNRLK